MTSARIVTVEWLDRDADEAVITVGDGNVEMRCFAHPFGSKIGASVSVPLETLGADYIARASGLVRPDKAGGNFTQWFVGSVVSTSPPVVRVGGILVELDAPIPGDITTGEIVEVHAQRIDFVA